MSRIIKQITRVDKLFDLKVILDWRDFLTILESDNINNPVVVLNCAVQASRQEYNDAVGLLKKLADFL